METAESYRVDSEGSEEKLLVDDSDTEQTEETEVQSDDGEEDDIVKLMGFDKNSSDESIGKTQRTNKPVLRFENKQRPLTDKSDVIELKTVKLQPTKEEMKIALPAKSKRPASTAILDRHERMRKIYKKHNSQTGKMVCGMMCIFIILGIGSVCLFFAHTAGMNDLYIIGGIFTGGGALFTLSFIVLRCTVDKRNADRDYSVLFKSPVE